MAPLRICEYLLPFSKNKPFISVDPPRLEVYVHMILRSEYKKTAALLATIANINPKEKPVRFEDLPAFLRRDQVLEENLSPDQIEQRQKKLGKELNAEIHDYLLKNYEMAALLFVKEANIDPYDLRVVINTANGILKDRWDWYCRPKALENMKLEEFTRRPKLQHPPELLKSLIHRRNAEYIKITLRFTLISLLMLHLDDIIGRSLII